MSEDVVNDVVSSEVTDPQLRALVAEVRAAPAEEALAIVAAIADRLLEVSAEDRLHLLVVLFVILRDHDGMRKTLAQRA